MPLRQLLKLEERLLWDLHFVDVQNINDRLQWLKDDIVDWLLVFDHLQELHDPAEWIIHKNFISSDSLDEVVIVAFNKFNLQPLVGLCDEVLEFVESVDQMLQLMFLERPAPPLDGVQKCLERSISSKLNKKNEVTCFRGRMSALNHFSKILTFSSCSAVSWIPS